MADQIWLQRDSEVLPLCKCWLHWHVGEETTKNAWDLVTSGPFVQQAIPTIIFCVTDLRPVQQKKIVFFSIITNHYEHKLNFSKMHRSFGGILQISFVIELQCFVHTLHQNVHYRSLYIFSVRMYFSIQYDSKY
ncbi:hypothetical protein BDA96_01G479100 [Sorghum bicolor]|jgi:hypothetical protein|uniref:Uncharacterized protein n=1 Tax=Sorghum bicolor TaxID=4558 RepID=A0A921S5M5_SORBI|nr:hypothetical protein BDA96_01G479100 [Sorghum bicolor]